MHQKANYQKCVCAQVRAQEAEADLNKNGLGGLVTIRQRNVEEQGFPAELAGCADAVFLDLPGPWKVCRDMCFIALGHPLWISLSAFSNHSVSSLVHVLV